MKVTINGKQYDGEEFYKSELSQALEDSQSDGYRPLFMPELIDQRTKNPNLKT